MTKSVYFIGIGGIGMSALARHYKALNQANGLIGRRTKGVDLAQNWAVSGSDIADSKLLKELRKEGIKVTVGHRTKNIGQRTKNRPDLVIYNQAVSKNNPELKEAIRLGIKTLSYPEAIGELTKQHKTIAITGSHGKSTTTAIMSLVLINAGFDPTVIVGTRVKEFGNANFRLGSQSNDIARLAGALAKRASRKNPNDLRCRYLVLEADEYGRAFLHYSPYAAIITNIDKEHLDTYKNLAGVKKAFLRFISNIQDNGILVLNSGDKNLKSLEREIVSACKKKRVEIFWYDKNQHIKGLASLDLLPSLLGEHNISNASGAYALAKALGIDDKIIFDTLKNFSGTWRRLEFRGYYAPYPKPYALSVFDDYAHHPTEIRASLSALQHSNILQNVGMLSDDQNSSSTIHQLTPRDIPLICVFQPHQTERLATLFQDFVNAFKDADFLILLPVYQVAGREKINVIARRKIGSQELAKAIQKKYPEKRVVYLKNPKNLPRVLSSLYPKPNTLSPVLVLMGAGDIVKYTDSLLQEHRGRSQR